MQELKLFWEDQFCYVKWRGKRAEFELQEQAWNSMKMMGSSNSDKIHDAQDDANYRIPEINFLFF